MHSLNGQFKISIVPTKKISVMWAIAVSLIQLGRDALMLMTLGMITLPLNRWSSLMRCVRSAARQCVPVKELMTACCICPMELCMMACTGCHQGIILLSLLALNNVTFVRHGNQTLFEMLTTNMHNPFQFSDT